MILNARRARKKSESQMGFEATAIRQLIGTARSRRVVGSNPNWDLDIFRVLLAFNINLFPVSPITKYTRHLNKVYVFYLYF